MRVVDGPKAGRLMAAAVIALALAIGAWAAQGAGGTATAQPAAVPVAIVDFGFNPASVTVPVGGRVTWTNTGQAPHTSTSQAGGWNSNMLSPGQTFTFTADRAGSFAYVCAIHPSMMGTVVVQAAAAPAPAPAPAAAPAPAPAPAAPPAAPAGALPRSGVGGGLVADNEGTLLALALGAALVLGFTALAYRAQRR